MPTANITDAKCVLVIGATSGIGRELALAIHNLDSKPTVIVAGRRLERLNELASRSDRIEGVQVDLTAGRATLESFVMSTIHRYPEVSDVGLTYTFDRVAEQAHLVAGHGRVRVRSSARIPAGTTRNHRPR